MASMLSTVFTYACVAQAAEAVWWTAVDFSAQVQRQRGEGAPEAPSSEGRGIVANPAGNDEGVSRVALSAISHAKNHFAIAVFFTLCAMKVIPGGAWIGVALIALHAVAISIDQGIKKSLGRDPSREQIDREANKRFPKEYHYRVPQFLGLIPERLKTAAIAVNSTLETMIPGAKAGLRDYVIPALRQKIQAAQLPFSVPVIAAGLHLTIGGILFLVRRTA